MVAPFKVKKPHVKAGDSIVSELVAKGSDVHEREEGRSRISLETVGCLKTPGLSRRVVSLPSFLSTPLSLYAFELLARFFPRS